MRIYIYNLAKMCLDIFYRMLFYTLIFRQCCKYSLSLEPFSKSSPPHISMLRGATTYLLTCCLSTLNWGRVGHFKYYCKEGRVPTLFSKIVAVSWFHDKNVLCITLEVCPVGKLHSTWSWCHYSWEGTLLCANPAIYKMLLSNFFNRQTKGLCHCVASSTSHGP